MQRRGALSGASLLSGVGTGHEAWWRRVCGAARASRTKSEISCMPGMFLCFDLDSSPLWLRRVKAQALRGNKKTSPACRRLFGSKRSLLPNNPRLEAHILHTDVTGTDADLALKSSTHHCRHCALLSYRPPYVCSIVYAASTKASPRSGLTFSYFGPGLFRERNTNLFAENQILDSTRRMSTADKPGSKLSASMTRQQGRRVVAFPVEHLGKGVEPPLHPPCRFARHAETVPVSAPFGLRGAVPLSSPCETRR
jgi:hypothetical protein